LKSKTSRDIYSQEDVDKMRTWEFVVDLNCVPKNGTAEVFEIAEKEPEFSKVVEYFKMYMPSESPKAKSGSKVFKVTKVSKIINPRLRSKWLEHYRDIVENNKDNPSLPITRLLWHGSGTTKPSEIYEDTRFGWKINYSSQKNLWGNGLYFGEDAAYCHKYVHKLSEKKSVIFLAEVITGDDIISLENDALREPFKKEDGKTRYDSICGVRHEKSWIWVVYASGTAYPAYLVEYEE